MAYTDDWESLMNGVFGPGGKLKFSQSTPQAAQPKPEKPEKTQDSPLPDWNAALLARQKKLDEMLKQQNAALKGQNAATTSALEDSRKMLRDMEEDGLLAKGTADAKPEHLGSFEGLADEVKKTVLGQDAFVKSVARAAVWRRGHRAALCPDGNSPLHGGTGPAPERSDRLAGSGPLPQLRGGKTLFAGSVRGPVRPR